MLIKTRLIGVLAACGAAAALAGAAAYAQEAFPSRPVRVVVPYAAGGTVDLLMRLVGPKLSEIWNQPFIVDNKPGGGTIIGSEAVVRAPADGHTLLAVANTLAVNPSFRKALPYDTLKDLVPVLRIASTPLLLAVHPSVPAQSVAELVALAKQSPGKLSYGSIGSGSSSHLAGEAFEGAATIDMTHVPYKGQAPALNDLLGGHVSLMFGNMPDLMPQVRAGKLRALGITSEKRSRLAPDLPTMAELGFPDVVAESWFALLVPAGTPANVVTRLNRDFQQVLAQSDIEARLIEQGLERSPGTPAEFADYLRAEIAKYAKIVKQAGIEPE